MRDCYPVSQSPKKVTSISSLLTHSHSYLQKIRIRLVRIETLVGPHNRNHISIPYVLDIMCIACRNIDNFKSIATYRILDNLITANLTETDHALTFYNQELLILAVMPVIPFCNSRPGYIDPAFPN